MRNFNYRFCLCIIGFTFILCVFFNISVAFSQQIKSDTININAVTITSSRLNNFSAGTKITAFDSVALNNYKEKNLADLLADESPVFIKSYGLGSLASTSFRGGNAGHTAVLWNGFNINSSMYGQTDLALVPVFIGQSVLLQYGGSAALWGSGAVGGAIHVNNYPVYDKGFTAKVNLSVGSYKNFKEQISFELSKKKFITRLRIINHNAKNNFKYKNMFAGGNTNIKKTQTNATLYNYGFITENYFKINNEQELNLMFWWQKTEREIPPTMLQEANQSVQNDNNYRLCSAWKYNKKKLSATIRSAFFNEELKYEDDTYRFSEKSRASEFIMETETKYLLNKSHAFNIGINNTYTSAITPNYSSVKNQNRTAIFISYSFISVNEKINATVSGRQELKDESFNPFACSAGVNYHFTNYLSLKGSVAKVYRIPTLNDLYWNPGGNPNLLSESGYTQEAGLKLNVTGEFISLSSEATCFNRNMKDWIAWVPGASYWSPENISSVWSRGLESNNMLAIKAGKTKFSLALITNYVLSTKDRADYENDQSIGKQLIYVPIYSGLVKTTIEYRQIAFTYRHNYTGYRYTSTDNTQYLKPYDLGSVAISYQLKIKNYGATASFQANNIWNKTYQLLLYRAMPKTNFEVGISFFFNNPNKIN